MKCDIRPNLRLVQQVARIERFCGAWERLSQSTAIASNQLEVHALQWGSISALALDSSTPPSLALMLAKLFGEEGAGTAFYSDSLAENTSLPTGLDDPALEQYIRAHALEFQISSQGVHQLYSRVTGAGVVDFDAADAFDQATTCFRKGTVQFLSPSMEAIFPTVPAFLIEQRLFDLLEWTSAELERGVIHPLFVIGTFYLLFLQVHPYPTANHRLAQLMAWNLLEENEFAFVRFAHFSPVLLARRKQYFNALRQAEKTAFGNWSTLNIWLDFFLDTLIETTENLWQSCRRDEQLARLSGIQRQIIEVIKEHGSVTRERIATETGINLSTVKYNLSVLSERGHLRRQGGGRTTSYTVL